MTGRLGYVRRDLAAVALVLAGLGATVLVLRRPQDMSGPVRVVDGDTLDLQGRRIRLTGIDAPEFAQACGAAGRTYPCGVRARDGLRAAVGGGEVRCRVSGRDRWGRSLATCFSDGRDLAATLVSLGLAVASGGYGAEERAAKRASRGLWAGPFERPSEWRRRNGRAPAHTSVQ